MLCWVLSPLFFACFAIPLLSGLALRHALRILGVILWPLGLALASTITEGLLDAQTNQQFFALGPVAGSFGYALQNLFAVAAVGLWILFSTVLAPAFIQRLVSGGGTSGGLISRATELLVNTGIPLLGHGASRFRSEGESFRRSSSSQNENNSRSLIHVEPPPASPVEPPTLRQLSDDDPTASNAVRQALEENTEDES